MRLELDTDTVPMWQVLPVAFAVFVVLGFAVIGFAWLAGLV